MSSLGGVTSAKSAAAASRKAMEEKKQRQSRARQSVVRMDIKRIEEMAARRDSETNAEKMIAVRGLHPELLKQARVQATAEELRQASGVGGVARAGAPRRPSSMFKHNSVKGTNLLGLGSAGILARKSEQTRPLGASVHGAGQGPFQSPGGGAEAKEGDDGAEPGGRQHRARPSITALPGGHKSLIPRGSLAFVPGVADMKKAFGGGEAADDGGLLDDELGPAASILDSDWTFVRRMCNANHPWRKRWDAWARRRRPKPSHPKVQ